MATISHPHEDTWVAVIAHGLHTTTSLHASKACVMAAVRYTWPNTMHSFDVISDTDYYALRHIATGVYVLRAQRLGSLRIHERPVKLTP